MTTMINEQIPHVISKLDETLVQSIIDFNESADAALYALDRLLKERLDWWNEKRESEIQFAWHTKDSYLRYHLLKLIQAEDKAVHYTQKSVRDEFNTWLETQQKESNDFRHYIKEEFVEFTGLIRTDLATTHCLETA